MNLLRAGAATLLMAGVATSAWAQSLGDIAKREEQRRKAIASPGKVYTNDNLRPVPESIPSSPGPATSPATTVPAGGTPPAPDPQVPPGSQASPPGEPKKDEAYWRKRIDDARVALARAQTFHDALQNQINSLSADFVNRDDPAQRAKIADDRQKALAELDRLKLEIVQGQKTIADIQEEARRAGVPVGWVR